MTSHMKSSHSGVKRAKPEFPCMICNEIFPRKVKLTAHLFEAHDIAEVEVATETTSNVPEMLSSSNEQDHLMS